MTSIAKSRGRSLSISSSTVESAQISRATTGGNEPKQPYQHFGSDKIAMPHMPLDTEIHWDWRNPLNLIPGALLAIFILDILALLF